MNAPASDGHWSRWAPRVLLAAAVAHLVFVLADRTLCFQDAEVGANFAGAALRGGSAFSWRDVVNAFDVWGLDGDSRPRFVSYLCMIWTLKARLALWRFVPMHPSFSPLWAVTLLAAPVFLYRFLRRNLGAAAAAAGTAVYLTSPGLLSSAAYLFHPGKPLSNVALIAALCLADRARTSAGKGAGAPRLPAAVALGIAILLSFLLLADETAAFALLIIPIWSPAHFLPPRRSWKDVRTRAANAAVLALPVAVYLAIVFGVAPRVCRGEFGRTFDFLSYIARTGQAGKSDLAHAARNAVTLLSAGLLPWRLVGLSVPADERSGLVWPAVAALAASIALAWRGFRPRKELSGDAARLAALGAGFVAFTTYASAHHPRELTSAGYYYGSAFSVLFAVAAAWTFALIDAGGARRGGAALAFAAYVLAVQAGNFRVFTRSWREHDNFKTLGWLAQLPYQPLLMEADVSRLPALFARRRGIYAPDVAPEETGTAAALRDMWRFNEDYARRGPARVPPSAFGDEGSGLPWAQARAYELALARAGGGGLPVLAFRAAPAAEQDPLGRDGRAGYPWFDRDLRSGTARLREVGYNRLVFDPAAAPPPPGPRWDFARAFIAAYRAKTLGAAGLVPLARATAAGRPVLVFEIGRGA